MCGAARAEVCRGYGPGWRWAGRAPGAWMSASASYRALLAWCQHERQGLGVIVWRGPGVGASPGTRDEALWAWTGSGLRAAPGQPIVTVPGA